MLIGFHGCDQKDYDDLLTGKNSFKQSTESFDWLGHGMYFWENNLERAWHWARLKKKAGTLQNPAVIGAIIDLGYCFDLLDARNIDLLKKSYDLLNRNLSLLHKELPENKQHPFNKDKDKDKVLRYLDCAVVENVHQVMKQEEEKRFDSVRAAFIEGEVIYPQAGFHDKTHIQICVINPNCIKGFFRPRNFDKSYPVV